MRFLSETAIKEIAAWSERCVELQVRLGHNIGASEQLVAENIRMRSDLDWFKHRLTQVERERGQLMQAALGVKIAVPEFVPTYRPDEAVNEHFAPFEDMGGDGHATPAVEDYTQLPGYRAHKA